MKKFIGFLFLILITIVFAGIFVSGNDSSVNDEVVGVAETRDGAGSDGISIEEQVLLDRDGLKITAKEYVVDSIWGDGIKIYIENNTDHNMGISCNSLIVNNYMINDLFVRDVAAGKKANETIYLYSSELRAAGIDNVGQVEIVFHVYDEDYRTLFNSDLVTIKTSAFDNMDLTPADSGEELLNQNGIRIVGKYVDEDSFWGTGVLLYLENNSGQNIGVSCENMSINGFMVDPVFFSSIYDGKMAIDEITIFSSDLEENGITSVEDIELTFHIYNSYTYEKIVDTEPISFSVK